MRKYKNISCLLEKGKNKNKIWVKKTICRSDPY